MRYLLKGGIIVDGVNHQGTVSDVLIEDGVITSIGENITVEGAETIDVSGQHIFPGLIDIHCHLRDPGEEYKEDIRSGTRAAAAGGFTTIVPMPNTSPVCDDKTVVTYIKSKAAMEGYVNVLPTGAVTKGLLSKELAEMQLMKEAGIVAVSDDGLPVLDAALFRKALQYAHMLDLPVIDHSEELSLSKNGSLNEGATATMMGLRGIPAAAEEVSISRDILLAESVNAPIHITHVSTKGAVEIIRQAKARGVKVTCDTCPHYLTLTDSAAEGFNTNAKVSPPLRSQSDKEAMLAALKDGTVDLIATDHAPHHIDDKNVEFDYAAKGMIGFQTAFPVLYTKLVKEGKLPLGELVRLMSHAPSTFLKLGKGKVEVGAVADITVVDLESRIEVTEEFILSKSKNTPFMDEKLYGKVLHTFVGGKCVLKDGVI